MLLARVEGNIVATRKHPSFDAWRLVICQPIGGNGQPEGAPIITFEPGTREALKPGAHFFLSAKREADGGLSATRVAVGKDGLVPPM